MEPICALSTPPGSGAIAVIRLSGEGSIEMADTVFFSPSGKRLTHCPPNTVVYGEIRSGDEVLDEVLVTLFRSPHSFTGEDTVEFSCHGSPYILRELLQLLIRQGARTALPGEFTQRAFLHGKIDLSRAEAIADLIASGTAAQHRLAMNQMRGGFSHELARLRTALVEITSLIELELDFSGEDVTFADRNRLRELALEIKTRLSRLTASFAAGNAIRNGVPVAIIGSPNAGKSTLLNLLLGEERAIVSPLPGTTRDTVEDTLVLSGIPFRLIDTAGIREHTSDEVEAAGISRTFRAIDRAAVVIWVVDLTAPPGQTLDLSRRILPSTHSLIVLLNKKDLVHPDVLVSVVDALGDNPPSLLLPFSALEAPDLTPLHQALVNAAALPALSEDVVVTNVRHYEALSLAHEAISRVLGALDTCLPADLLTQDLRDCLHHLGLITGEITTDEILHSIFSRFCIGK
jgi:tRNA modification GTPase